MATKTKSTLHDTIARTLGHTNTDDPTGLTLSKNVFTSRTTASLLYDHLGWKYADAIIAQLIPAGYRIHIMDCGNHFGRLYNECNIQNGNHLYVRFIIE